MKKTVLTLVAMLVSIVVMSQFYVYKDGHLVYGIKGSVADSVTFVEPKDIGLENDYEWVDLGLTSGTKWATKNIGAKKPQDCGDYYAWAEVAAKSVYDVNTYKYAMNGDIFKLTKYCAKNYMGYNGYTDERSILDSNDDAAHVNLGGRWYVPTMEQQEELSNECYWVWTDNYNGSNVAGYIVYRAKNSMERGEIIISGDYPSSSYSLSDAHIFLPVTGFYTEECDNCIERAGTHGYYWASSLMPDYSFSAYSMFFYSKDIQSAVNNRDNGLPIRPVIPGWNADVTISATSIYKSGVENGHDYVELGLPSNTKWATANIGSATPQDYGNYYAWGEVEMTPQASDLDSWSSYKYANGSINALTKYCNNSNWGDDGFTDSKTVLELEDDAAHVNWGGRWTMPTKKQLQELVDNCYWVWTKNYNGSYIKGYIVYKAKTNTDKGKIIYLGDTPSSSYSLSDAHIFLPAAGTRSGGLVNREGEFGYYSSTSLSDEGPYVAWSIRFQFDGLFDLDISRSSGNPVRPVIPGE